MSLPRNDYTLNTLELIGLCSGSRFISPRCQFTPAKLILPLAPGWVSMRPLRRISPGSGVNGSTFNIAILNPDEVEPSSYAASVVFHSNLVVPPYVSYQILDNCATSPIFSPDPPTSDLIPKSLALLDRFQRNQSHPANHVSSNIQAQVRRNILKEESE